MKKVYLIILGLIVALSANSQSITVSSFKLLDTDLTANTAGTMELDQNGETAALIKVVTTQTGFTFDGGALGVVKTIQKPAEIWVYVPRGLKKITISHPQLGMLRDYYFNISVDAAKTYELVLVTGEVQTTIKQARTSQYVVFQLTPPNAVVELDGEQLETADGIATKFMKFGTYNYHVNAPNYLPEAGNVTVNDPRNKHIVNVSLKPNFSQVTLKVDNGAEIWVNGEQKGVGTWTGNLGAGTYEIETKKEGHRNSVVTRDIVVTSTPQTIQLQAPTPIYGEANINTTPAMADIYIDGEKKGKTPEIVSNILIGEHTILLEKEGYITEKKIIVIKEGEIAEVNISLKEYEENVDTDKGVVKSKDIKKRKARSNKVAAKAHEFMLAGNENEAYKMFMEANVNDLDVKSLNEFVRCSYFTGHFADALRASETGLKFEPRNPVFNRLAMYSSCELKKNDKAYYYLNRYFNETDNVTFNEYDYLYSGLIYESLSNYKSAIEEYKKGMRLVKPESMLKTEAFQLRIDACSSMTLSFSTDLEKDVSVISKEQSKNDNLKNLEYRFGSQSFKMVYVEGGEFLMGPKEYNNRVKLPSYYIGETEVTQALWSYVTGTNPSDIKGDDMPVQNVSWEECQTFINKLNGLTGKNFRLPSESEWEFAAKGGNMSRDYIFSGSNDIGDVAWYDKNSNGSIHYVKNRKPNELGIYDMSGNVWEWCQDWFSSYSSENLINNSGNKVYRGGSYNLPASYHDVTRRDSGSPKYRVRIIGLRLALSVE